MRDPRRNQGSRSIPSSRSHGDGRARHERFVPAPPRVGIRRERPSRAFERVDRVRHTSGDRDSCPSGTAASRVSLDPLPKRLALCPPKNHVFTSVTWSARDERTRPHELAQLSTPEVASCRNPYLGDLGHAKTCRASVWSSEPGRRLAQIRFSLDIRHGDVADDIDHRDRLVEGRGVHSKQNLGHAWSDTNDSNVTATATWLQ